MGYLSFSLSSSPSSSPNYDAVKRYCNALELHTDWRNYYNVYILYSLVKLKHCPDENKWILSNDDFDKLPRDSFYICVYGGGSDEIDEIIMDIHQKVDGRRGHAVARAKFTEIKDWDMISCYRCSSVSPLHSSSSSSSSFSSSSSSGQSPS